MRKPRPQVIAAASVACAEAMVRLSILRGITRGSLSLVQARDMLRVFGDLENATLCLLAELAICSTPAKSLKKVDMP